MRTMSNPDNIDDLINRLENELEAARPLPCPLQRSLVWFAAGLLCVILIGAFINFRMDLGEKLTQPPFLLEMGLILVVAFSAAYASAWLSLPDGAENRFKIILPYGLLALTVFVFFEEFQNHGLHLESFHWSHCIIDGIIMGTVPVVMMVWMMRAGAPTRPTLAALTNMVAAGSIGYLGLRLTCGSDTMAHVCIYHVMPFVMAGLVIGLLARRLYRW